MNKKQFNGKIFNEVSCTLHYATLQYLENRDFRADGFTYFTVRPMTQVLQQYFRMIEYLHLT